MVRFRCEKNLVVWVFMFNSNSIREAFLAGMEQCIGNEGGLLVPYFVFDRFGVDRSGN